MGDRVVKIRKDAGWGHEWVVLLSQLAYCKKEIYPSRCEWRMIRVYDMFGKRARGRAGRRVVRLVLFGPILRINIKTPPIHSPLSYFTITILLSLPVPIWTVHPRRLGECMSCLWPFVSLFTASGCQLLLVVWRRHNRHFSSLLARNLLHASVASQFTCCSAAHTFSLCILH